MSAFGGKHPGSQGGAMPHESGLPGGRQVAPAPEPKKPAPKLDQLIRRLKGLRKVAHVHNS